MKLSVVSLLFLLLTTVLLAQPSPSFVLEFTGFVQPTSIRSAQDGTDRLFVTEQRGTIQVIDSTGTTLATPFLDIISQVENGGNEQGLLGLAFHPDYASNGHLYINYTKDNDSSVVSRWTVSADSNVVDPSSESILLTCEQPYRNHNEGDLHFDPDGMLYIASGDGGSGGDPFCYAQDSTLLLGKILRLDVDQQVNQSPYHGIPADNPFVDIPGARDEIWALGLRNPWRISFDRLTGDLWIADVGQGTWEEVNRQPSTLAGVNYGWKIKEGPACFSTSNCDPTVPSCASTDITDPIFSYDHFGDDGGQSITGGFVYRGCKYPVLDGQYICADFVSGNVWLVDSSGQDTLYQELLFSVTSFGEDERGEIYATQRGGDIYRLTESTEVDCECLTQLILSGVIDTDVYTARALIRSTGTVQAGSVVDLLAPEISLEPGFTVEQLATLTTMSADCDLFVSRQESDK